MVFIGNPVMVYMTFSTIGNFPVGFNYHYFAMGEVFSFVPIFAMATVTDSRQGFFIYCAFNPFHFGIMTGMACYASHQSRIDITFSVNG
jgi:hypothetical protein